MSVFTELRRRNVYRIAAAYVVAAWLIIQVVETIFPAFGFDEATIRLTIILLLIGFVPAILLTWAFEITPQGIRRDRAIDRDQTPDSRSRKRLDQIIITILAIAVTFFALDKFVLVEPDKPAPDDIQSTIAVGGSIAVMPFVDMSPQHDQSYLADGISEELLNLLSRIPQLRVVSRSSSFAFRDRSAKAGDIAEELNVNYILEGSVRKNGDQVRITAQLIDALTDTHVWSSTYERKLEDIFAIQDEIATAVIPALEIELLNELPVTTETDTDAYTLYLKGVYYYRQRTSPGLERAIDHLLRSVEIDPDYAPPWIVLASTYINQAETGQRNFIEAYELATRATDRALELDSQLPFAHSARAWIAFNYERDYQKSARHFRLARTLFPNSNVILANSSVLLEHLGRLDDALQLVNRAIALEPTDSVGYSMRGLHFLRMGRLNEAQADFTEALSLSPTSGYHFGNRALLRILQGRPMAAIEDAEMMDDEALKLAVLTMAYFDLGDLDASDKAIDTLQIQHAAASPFKIAAAHAWRGETDDAFAWLERAIVGGHAVFGIKTDPLFHSLMDDPRWDGVLSRLELTDEQVDDLQL